MGPEFGLEETADTKKQRLVVMYRQTPKGNNLSGFVLVPEGVDLSAEWQAFKETERKKTFTGWLEKLGVVSVTELNERYRIEAQKSAISEEEREGMPVLLDLDNVEADLFLLS